MVITIEAANVPVSLGAAAFTAAWISRAAAANSGVRDACRATSCSMSDSTHDIGAPSPAWRVRHRKHLDVPCC